MRSRNIATTLRDDAAIPEPQTVWHIKMLGGLVATPMAAFSSSGVDSRVPVEQFRTHKAALLLARLALFPQRAQGREELADLLWPDLPPERGRANLTLTLVYLRQAFGQSRKGGLFAADHKTVRVARGLLQTDTAAWEVRAAQALTASTADGETRGLLKATLAAYTGDLLPGFYEDWVCDERNRLSALHDALRERFEATPTPLEPIAVNTQRTITSIDSSHRPPVIVNAPLYLTHFFGRTLECESAVRLLYQDPPTRLLTLLGTGGIGKTRLALQIAQAVLATSERRDPSPAGFGWIAFVPLAEARTPLHMEGILLRVLGIQSAGNEGMATIVDHLSGRAAQCQFQGANRLLLVLDNLEQLGEASASVVTRLLTAVPALTILATSRQPVGVAGEQEQRIGSLRGVDVARDSKDLPDDVRLFLDRARLVRTDLERSPRIVEEVTHLCALLEGIPLALELAATWTRVLSPPQIVARLEQRFDLLSLRGTSKATGGELPARHRSLYAVVSWSYDLLEPSLQSFFAQLSVFHGGWTIESAQEILGVSDASESLLLLAERSLIVVEENVGEACPTSRCQMLETLREFAQVQWKAQASADEQEGLLLRHAAYFDTLSQQADSQARGGTRARALLRVERDNLRAAIVSSLQQASPDAEEPPVPERHKRYAHCLRIIVQSAWLWTIKELEYFCDLGGAAIPILPDEAYRSLESALLLLQGVNALNRGHYEAANHYLHASLTRYEASGDRSGSIRAKGRLANLAYQTGDRASAVTAWRECAAEAQRIGDGRLESAMKSNLAVVLPDLNERRMLGEEAVALDRIHVPDSYILACALNTLGNAAREQADYATAQSCLEEGYALARADGSISTVALLQTSLVELYLETSEQLDRARVLLCDAQHVFEEVGELPQVIGVLALRVRLALRQGEADEALSLGRQSLRMIRQINPDSASVAAHRADISNQLQQAGFVTHDEEWAVVEVRNDVSPG